MYATSSSGRRRQSIFKNTALQGGFSSADDDTLSPGCGCIFFLLIFLDPNPQRAAFARRPWRDIFGSILSRRRYLAARLDARGFLCRRQLLRRGYGRRRRYRCPLGGNRGRLVRRYCWRRSGGSDGWQRLDLPQRRAQVVDQLIGLVLRENATASRKAEFEQSGVTLHRDIQGAAVIGDRNREIVRHFRPGHVERHRWSGDVGDCDVANLRKAAHEVGTAEQRG